MQVTLLGTGAPLVHNRATTGMVVTAPGCAPLLIDTCGGFELIRQLDAAGFKLADVRNVVVTHRHLDHAGGLQCLLLARIPLAIHANADTLAGVRQMTAGCFPEWEQHPEVRRTVVASGETRDIGGFRVEFFATVHRVPTLAARVTHGGRTFTFSADTLPCEAVVRAAKGADLFLCDAICADADGDAAIARAHANMHPTAREAALMANEAGARRLACTHIGRFGNADRILEEARQHFAGEVTVPVDGARLDV